MDKQDELLEQIDVNVKLKNLTKAMHTELTVQKTLLDDLNREVASDKKLQRTTEKTIEVEAQVHNGCAIL